jgi:CheY-like chemotaxis protein
MREMRVLVAEDNPISRLLACEFLASCGYRVSSAQNGAQALRMARSGRFEVMLLDLRMPILDGLQVIRAIRAETALDGLQVIAVTGEAGPGQREEFLAAGVDGFMTKPLDLTRLGAEIERLAVAHQAPRQGRF